MRQEEMEREFAKWLRGRPEVIQTLAAKFKPWHTYRLTATGQHCYPISYFEDGTLCVQICGHDDEFGAMMAQMMPLQVVGVEPETLEPLPNTGA